MNLKPGIHTPEEAAAAMEADARAVPDEHGDLKRRVAALEGLIWRLMDVLLTKGDLTVNDVRRIHDLPVLTLAGPSGLSADLAAKLGPKG